VPHNDVDENENELLAQIEADLLHALRDWHAKVEDDSPYSYLHLFQRKLRELNGDVRQATNALILYLFDLMRPQYPEEVLLLEARFPENKQTRVVANIFNVSEAEFFRRQKRAVKQIARELWKLELAQRTIERTQAEARLESPTYSRLFGVEHHLQQLQHVVLSSEHPITTIVGLGGIGKTSLANSLLRRLIARGLVVNVAWSTARQKTFSLDGRIKEVNKPILTVSDLVADLVSQLLPDFPLPSARTMEDAIIALERYLRDVPNHIIVIDNLEDLLDEALLLLIRRLAGPKTKFILTSRVSLLGEPFYHFVVPELSAESSLALIRYEAEARNLQHVVSATASELSPIFAAVGGNPLALRLVVGQLHVQGLDDLLEDLKLARGQKPEDLYFFIYSHMWQSLTEPERRILLAMPMIMERGGSLEFLLAITRLERPIVTSALGSLVRLNLVNKTTSLQEARYTIHSLTRTFLHKQVARWG
jgi:hypothetical protein